MIECECFSSGIRVVSCIGAARWNRVFVSYFCLLVVVSSHHTPVAGDHAQNANAVITSSWLLHVCMQFGQMNP